MIESGKQEGETCGTSRSRVCGVCASHLKCNAPMDACGNCVKDQGN